MFAGILAHVIPVVVDPCSVMVYVWLVLAPVFATYENISEAMTGWPLALETTPHEGRPLIVPPANPMLWDPHEMLVESTRSSAPVTRREEDAVNDETVVDGRI